MQVFGGTQPVVFNGSNGLKVAEHKSYERPCTCYVKRIACHACQGMLTYIGATGKPDACTWGSNTGTPCAARSFATPFGGTVKYILAVLQAPWSPTKLPYKGS